ncbi:1942_t:CDS:2, partial [Acaulospora colombiana]
FREKLSGSPVGGVSKRVHSAFATPKKMATTPVDNKRQRTSSNVFSMSDEALAGRYQFSKEHGVGNWGSVWLALDKKSASSADDQKKVAIKVVHRSKTAAAAVR